MKRTVVILIALCVCLSALAEDTDLFSESLELDIRDASSSIAKVTRKIAPMAKYLNEGSTKVQEAIAALKDDPNALNQAKFEKTLADYLKPVVGQIDAVLGNRTEMQSALWEVASEIERVNLIIKQEYQEKARDYDAQKAKMKGVVERLQTQAEKVKDAGEEVSRKDSADLKKLHLEFRSLQRQIELSEVVKRHLQHADKELSKSLGQLDSVSSQAYGWFEHLELCQKEFRSFALARKTFCDLGSVGGSEAVRVLRTFMTKFSDAMKNISQFTSLMNDLENGTDLPSTTPSIEILPEGMPDTNMKPAQSLADDIIKMDFSKWE